MESCNIYVEEGISMTLLDRETTELGKLLVENEEQKKN